MSPSAAVQVRRLRYVGSDVLSSLRWRLSYVGSDVLSSLRRWSFRGRRRVAHDLRRGALRAKREPGNNVVVGACRHTRVPAQVLLLGEENSLPAIDVARITGALLHPSTSLPEWPLVVAARDTA